MTNLLCRLLPGVAVLAFLAWAPDAAVAKPSARLLLLTPERLLELQQINSHVNSTIVEMSDMEQYGRPDVWVIPTSGKGDCEDFALLKRKLLMQRGWPAGSLTVAVVTTAQGEPHAVLVVATASGEYVLDNLTSSILTPPQSGHTYLARSTGRGWLSTSGERTAVPTVDLPVARRQRS